MSETASQQKSAVEAVNPTDSLPKVPLAAPFAAIAAKSEVKASSIFGKGDAKGEDSDSKDSAPAGFIFGAKLAERVVNGKKEESNDAPKDASSIFAKFAGNGAGFLAKGNGDAFASKPAPSTAEFKPFGGLATDKRKDSSLDVPTVTSTGEEGETNLLHIGCKFYIYERETKTYQERGNGVLRINRSKEEPDSYRIIGRATGNQRVCVNSKIFPDMLIEKISDKRIKLTAMNPETTEVPQIVIIHATPTSIATITQKLEELLSKVKIAKRKRKIRDSEDEVATKKENIVEEKKEEEKVKETEKEETAQKEEVPEKEVEN